ncbi:Lipid A disaccharide synthetase related enzyme [Richelia intracellularis HH01]|uniref:Lipid A disaccharide synthetase related enzyme n=1 Tax=Richelia intracellularis HH01 TaxID=1165094 RepID=M1X254_9NOST|nr:Lipid A disaccharide synthetase related enzyme [Richelia intracellularis]CCH66230.1 Lipid A disaccharide synthetase related enzyme [Richelia intracellularis HH01]
MKRNTKGTRWENFSGSIYHPRQRWLINHPLGKAVFLIDRFSNKQNFAKMPVLAFDLGNPMVDHLEPTFLNKFLTLIHRGQEE